MTLIDDFQRTLRERARWYILRTIDTSRPDPIGEGLLRDVIDGADCRITAVELRRELDFLCKLGLIELHKDPRDVHWEAELTAEGIQFTSYNSEEIPGIHRPRGGP